nr:retrotransposon protein, putative, Ty1-copia subclass [Tanacetum cinerariifolium]
MGYSFYYPPENKVLVARNAEFLENSLIDQEASGSLEDLEIIQEGDMHPFLDTSLNHEEDDLEIDEPQSDIVPIRRSTRTQHAPNREAAYILGIKIYRDRSKRLIGLCQSAYIDKILKQYCMENSKRGSIPMQEKLKLSKSQGASTPAEMKRMQNVLYASAVETEYIAAFDASKEAVWVKKFIFGLSVVPTIEEPISMYCDNIRAIAIANESGITKGARHLRAKVHCLQEVIEFGDIKLEKVHTDDNLADPFTKH